MTDDQFWRLVATAAAIPLWALVAQKTGPYLGRAWDKVRVSVPHKVGYLLGSLWARGHRTAQQALQRRRVR
jgi:hypothetical protein